MNYKTRTAKPISFNSVSEQFQNSFRFFLYFKRSNIYSCLMGKKKQRQMLEGPKKGSLFFLLFLKKHQKFAKINCSSLSLKKKDLVMHKWSFWVPKCVFCCLIWYLYPNSFGTGCFVRWTLTKVMKHFLFHNWTRLKKNNSADQCAKRRLF